MFWTLVIIFSLLTALLGSLAITLAVFYNCPGEPKSKPRPYVNRNILARGWCECNNSENSASEQKYLNENTEHLAKAKDMTHMVNSDMVWVRMGSPNRLQAYGYAISRMCDLDVFVKYILPKRTKEFTLITSDGDRSIPSELRSSTVHAILSSKLLKVWFTQNYDGTNPKIKPIPIGLCLHTQKGLHDPQLQFDTIRLQSTNVARKIRIWSDCHLQDYALRHGNPRGSFRKLMNRLKFVDAPPKRLTQAEIWKTYTEYGFVLSLPGNGLDCHRTWEALYLGAIVITVPNSLVPMYEGYRVELVSENEWLTKLNDGEWLQKTFEKHMANTPIFNDTPKDWLTKQKEKHD